MVVPRFYELWIGTLPSGRYSHGNCYERDNILLFITEHGPFSHEAMMKKLSSVNPHPSPAADGQVIPRTKFITDAEWRELPAGLRACYGALLLNGVAHYSPKPEHWRGDDQDQWRILDFTKAFSVDPPTEGPPATTHKSVRFGEGTK
jgi:hypothetical protein